MRLIKQMIKKTIELYEEYMINKNYLRGIWTFYRAYQICVAYLTVKEWDGQLKFDEEGKLIPLMTMSPMLQKLTKSNTHKNLIWEKYLSHPESMDSKRITKLLMYIQKDRSVINYALEQMELAEEEDTSEFGNMYKPLTIGCFAYEYPMEE